MQLRYRPFPLGIIRPALPQPLYDACTAAFPDSALFERIDKFGLKYSLSEKYASRVYWKFVRSIPVWQRLARWIWSDDFIISTLTALRDRGIDLGFDEVRVPLSRRVKRAIRDTVRRRPLRHSPNLSARFEFSMLPANGGRVLPHTDNPEKIVTLIVSMCGAGEWNESYGGGTDIVMPKNDVHLFDRLNDRDLDFGDVERLDTYPYLPNQVLMFVKTFNSWHSVEPMQGPDGLMRKTLTINIEAR
jgi:hypothetical protein